MLQLPRGRHNVRLHLQSQGWGGGGGLENREATARPANRVPAATCPAIAGGTIVPPGEPGSMPGGRAQLASRAPAPAAHAPRPACPPGWTCTAQWRAAGWAGSHCLQGGRGAGPGAWEPSRYFRHARLRVDPGERARCTVCARARRLLAPLTGGPSPMFCANCSTESTMATFSKSTDLRGWLGGVSVWGVGGWGAAGWTSAR